MSFDDEVVAVAKEAVARVATGFVIDGGSKREGGGFFKDRVGLLEGVTFDEVAVDDVDVDVVDDDPLTEVNADELGDVNGE